MLHHHLTDSIQCQYKYSTTTRRTANKDFYQEKPLSGLCDRPKSGKLSAKQAISSSKLGILTKHKMSPLDISSRAKDVIVKAQDISKALDLFFVSIEYYPLFTIWS